MRMTPFDGAKSLTPYVTRRAVHHRVGVYLRTKIKRAVMRGYCAGLVPAAVVTVTFRVFKLRSL
jgi:hypothetical protein